MSQVCIPSNQKSTSPLRFHNKTMAKKKIHVPADDINKTENHLHTLSRVGNMPVSPGYLKDLIVEYMRTNDHLPRYFITKEYSNNKSTSVWVNGFGVVHIQYKQGKKGGLSA